MLSKLNIHPLTFYAGPRREAMIRELDLQTTNPALYEAALAVSRTTRLSFWQAVDWLERAAMEYATAQPLDIVTPPAESVRASFTTPQDISRADVDRKRRGGRR